MNKKILLLVIAGLLVVSCIILFSLLPEGHKASKKALLATCGSNLKSISKALRLYASENNDYFPPYSGAEGLKLLFSLGYLKDESLLICPATSRLSTNNIIGSNSMKNISYEYKGGLKDNNIISPICWDKESNHPNEGINVLYTNGEIKKMQKVLGEGFK